MTEQEGIVLENEISSTCIMKPSQPRFIYANGVTPNPLVPYCDKIQELFPGDMIIINGFVPKSSKRLSSNFMISLLQQTDDKRPSIILNINVRFGQHVVAINHRVEEEWGQEETSGGLGKLAMKKPFECIIMLRDDNFKISFNGHHHSDFTHRLPYKQINQLSVEGTVLIRTITVQTTPESQQCHSVKSMPPLIGSNKQVGSKSKKAPMQHEARKFQLFYGIPVPHRDEILGGMKPSTALYICGIPHRNSAQFTFDLKPVPVFGQRDIALHMKVLMRQKAVVLNTMEHSKWGPEEKIMENFPFKAGVHYDLIIVCMEDHFKISVNNQHFAEYKHRMKSLDSINMYDINGSTKLIHIRKLLQDEA